jgi:toxin ParE1/3/4
VYGDSSESVADRLLDRIDAKLVLLSKFPFAGVARDDIRRGFRMLVSDEYLILYRILKKEIEIVRVVHGRRDLPKLDWTT